MRTLIVLALALVAGSASGIERRCFDPTPDFVTGEICGINGLWQSGDVSNAIDTTGFGTATVNYVRQSGDRGVTWFSCPDAELSSYELGDCTPGVSYSNTIGGQSLAEGIWRLRFDYSGSAFLTVKTTAGGGGGSPLSVDGVEVPNPNFDDGGHVDCSAVGSTIQCDVKTEVIPLNALSNVLDVGNSPLGGALTSLGNGQWFSGQSPVLTQSNAHILQASGEIDGHDCDGEVSVPAQGAFCLDIDGAAPGDGGRPALFMPAGANGSTSWRQVFLGGQPLDYREGSDVPGSAVTFEFCNEANEAGNSYHLTGGGLPRVFYCTRPTLPFVLGDASRWTELGADGDTLDFFFSDTDWGDELGANECAVANRAQATAANSGTSSCSTLFQHGAIGGHVIRGTLQGSVAQISVMIQPEDGPIDAAGRTRFCVAGLARDAAEGTVATITSACFDILGSALTPNTNHYIDAVFDVPLPANTGMVFLMHDNALESWASPLSAKMLAKVRIR